MANWVAAWGMAHCDITHFSPAYKNSTMRLSVYNNLDGTALRVHFYNKEGKKPMTIKKAVAACESITFDGKESVTLGPGEEVCSDPLEVIVKAGTYITVSVAYEGKVVSGNSLASTVQCSKKGDYTEEVQFPLKSPSLNARIFNMEKPIGGISGIDVLCRDAGSKALVCFGDSITQQSKWTEPLAYWLGKKYPGKASLVNMAIGGNRLLYGPMKIIGSMHGQAGKDRFDHDVLSVAGVSAVMLVIGTNDIGFFCDESKPEFVHAEQLEEGYREIISRCRENGLKVFGTTITPRCGVGNFKEINETERKKFNEWVRACGLFDAVFDFDEAVRDAKNPDILEFSCDSGDHLHPSAQGGMRLMRCITDKAEREGISLI